MQDADKAQRTAASRYCFPESSSVSFLVILLPFPLHVTETYLESYQNLLKCFRYIMYV